VLRCRAALGVADDLSQRRDLGGERLAAGGGQGIALIGAVLLAWAAFDARAGVRRVGDGNDDG
jgi:hypothetical protein